MDDVYLNNNIYLNLEFNQGVKDIQNSYFKALIMY